MPDPTFAEALYILGVYSAVDVGYCAFSALAGLPVKKQKNPTWGKIALPSIVVGSICLTLAYIL